MAKKSKRLAAIAAASVISVTGISGLLALTGCNNVDLKTGYRTYTSVMPSNWCELTYSDNNDTQIMNYIAGELFTFDYEFDESKGGKFKEDGTVNADAIIDGGYKAVPSAATAIEDVTTELAAKWGFNEEQVADGGYAWKFTLRNDIKWDDGTAINARDFEYSMKEQLDPKFQHLRVSSYYGSNIKIKNARGYVYQGAKGNGSGYKYGTSYEKDKDTMTFSWTNGYYVVEKYKNQYKPAWLLTAGFGGFEGVKTEEEGEAFLKAWEGKSVAECLADTGLMKTFLDSFLVGKERASWTAEDYDILLDTFNVDYEYPEMEFSEVGFYAESEYEFVIVLDAPIYALKDDGSLSYHAAYEFSGFPLVKKDLWESCKKAPQEGATLWTTNYCTSVETTASWGPYKLTSFQRDKQFVLERNDNWFNYGEADYANQYQVKTIVTEQIADTNTAWMSFLSGALDEIGLDVNHKDDYRNSKYTVFAPGTGTYAMNLYSNLEVLNKNGRNNSILAIKDFRQAVSLFLDRDDYNAATTTAMLSCYGLIGPSYYYDPENAGVYRDTEYAKKGLLRVYGFTELDGGKWTDGTNEYADYEAAYAAMKGYNPTLAKELVEKAYQELATNSAYVYDASKPIEIIYGTSVDNEGTRRDYNYLVKLFDDLTKGTSLEGKITLTFNASYGEKWAEDFRSGAYELASGTGFGGNALNPAGVLGCYVDPSLGLTYHTYWDVYSDNMTFTMPVGDYSESGKELTMSIYNWYACVNGMAESSNDATNKYNWSSGKVDEAIRLQVMSAIEEFILNKYYAIITTSQYSGSVTSAKYSYITENYNMYLGFGGFRYMIENYDDEAWAKYVKSTNLESEYKKTN